ncbi:serine acetyltransferase [Kurthia zopfii]|uniref:Serine acetyltransferase n=1 Tax=Kurthia zopfii TaxID=1650 RepID=A0A8B4Q9J9_9BACL|nr:serine O-acetyltransferase EpsC [Kurthia zopfii]PWI21838.1 serine acetyltransferase [Kurthia zopfii]TDR36567.1 serine O-acetyltransferase [Kurthia zopfii]GEK32363.1 serine acetyltransferase [Kurthia zopfii]STX09351.1 Serine acetyltransferase [Kurthia zopfii]
MELNEWLNTKVPQIATDLAEINQQYFDMENSIGFKGRDKVIKVIESFQIALFPGIYDQKPFDEVRLNVAVSNNLRKAALDLRDVLEKALFYSESEEKACEKAARECADKIVMTLMEKFPEIRRTLQSDIQAAYNGDPAATSIEEILLSYPSIQAVCIHRLAHELYKQDVKIIPRIMSEYAHELTGIDIHPGASIGDSFFIDHGTGVVIGETCTIGNNVKVYQGVTLGALSFPLDDDGNPIKGIKRHPDIEDNVVIYAGATILGGKTKVGHDSVLGSNIWLTHSIVPHSRVYHSQPSPSINQSVKLEYEI